MILMEVLFQNWQGILMRIVIYMVFALQMFNERRDSGQHLFGWKIVDVLCQKLRNAVEIVVLEHIVQSNKSVSVASAIALKFCSEGAG